ncbi:hypothetical protein TB9_03785 [Xanthomonas perforans]|uniref:Uncharacterized protein n=1 Tax=Xanthomonas perforans TaxID=442694 RepID=A0ABR5EQH0_XANPE|nr:hypothetical protein XP315_14945 [Xanthomonas perforans]KLC09686.1 hypothetical protein XP420_04760 [Xanthomonas perforans]KLC10647.1 hypothetical protein XP4B_15140 [Xanthomonas perforans]KLC20228.1 hypothetical protein XP712_10840 [Xanthomonas perforans]KLC21327.1 hypothetical protein XP816_18505 [Xanthomonas perforans]
MTRVMACAPAGTCTRCLALVGLPPPTDTLVTVAGARNPGGDRGPGVMGGVGDRPGLARPGAFAMRPSR